MTPTCSPPERPSLCRDERGIALAIAIFAMVIIATLVTGVFFMARLEQRSGNSALWSTQAQEAADAGLSATLAAWPSAANSAPLGQPQPLATTSLGANIRYKTTVTKMSAQIFLVQSTGERTDAGGGVLAGASVGRIVRLVIPDLSINAAVTANGPVTQGGNSEVHGANVVPPNWSDCAPGSPVAGIRTSATYNQNGNASDLTGAPPLVENDPTVTSAKIVGPFNELAAVASIKRFGNWSNSERPGPEVSGGVCTTDDLNWGEPWRSDLVGGPSGLVGACTGRLPIIHITGNASLSGAGGGRRGQGILLVGGDLSISGNFEFTGIVIVLGSFSTTGTGSKITGAVLAENAAVGDDVNMTGDPHVLYSSCAISTVLAGSATARPLAERSWVQMY